jgi:HEAT repeat protein
LRDADAEVQAAAAHALGAFGTAAQPAVASMLAVASTGVVADYDFGEALAQIVTDPSSLQTALHSRNVATSRRAALALGRMRAPASEGLIEALGSPVPSVRAAALAGLVPATAGAAAALPVSRLLDDDSAEVRHDALVFLSNLGRSAEAARPAVAAKTGDAVPRVRAVAVEALARIAVSPAAMAPAVPLLRDPEPEVRQAAARALTTRPAGPSTLPALLGLLEEAETALFAAQAIGALRVKEGVPPLMRLLGSKDPVTRTAAARALARVGPLAAPAAGLLLGALEQETEEASRCGYWNALVALGPAAASQVSQAGRVLGEMAAVCEKARVPAVRTP